MSITLLKLESVNSTNTYVREHIADLADGTLVVAATQSAGRGRRGRIWQSKPGVNLYATLTLKELFEPVHAGFIMALATLRTVRALVPQSGWFVKWPNDIYVEDRKAAGLLCETCTNAAGAIVAVAAGVGLNVNLTNDDLAAIDIPAASLAAESGHKFDLDKVIGQLMTDLESMTVLYREHPDLLLAIWRAENRLLGQRITLLGADGSHTAGVFCELKIGGELVLQLDSGEQKIFNCGDVSIDKKSVDWQQVTASLSV